MVLSDKIAMAINVHTDPLLVRANINCLQTNITNNIQMLVEGSAYNSWPKDKFTDIKIINGFKHDYRRNPYKNVFYNLMETYKSYPDMEWYGYTESDNFILTDTIRLDLSLINEAYQLVATDFRPVFCDGYTFHKIFEKIIRNHYCILGCCYFIRKNLMKELCEKYIPKFLNYASLIPDCYFFPNFYQYDVAEVFLPTLCYYLNYNVFNLASWKNNKFLGMGHLYKMRFTPHMTKNDLTQNTCIIHAIKDRNVILEK